MNIFTVKGRLQTKLMTFVLAAGITAIYSAYLNASYWPLFALSIIAGLLLELLWGWVITYQAGYLVWLLGAAEFCVITAAAITLALPFTIAQAAVYYWVTWALIQIFLIYIMPIINLSWADNGGELW